MKRQVIRLKEKIGIDWSAFDLETVRSLEELGTLRKHLMVLSEILRLTSNIAIRGRTS